MQQLEAHEMALHKVFSSDYDFTIPDYQRPYAWDAELATQLLLDLEEALDRDDGEPYFLGSLVLVKLADRPPAEVIDGQQRLTTVTILLAVLRDLAEGALRASMEKMITEPGEPTLDLLPKPRLSLRERDAHFFREHVQTTGSIAGLLGLGDHPFKTDAQKAIHENTAALHAELVAWSPERRFALMKMISKRTFLVVVSTPNLDSAHRIFSVMNARGLDLSPADIFKSKVIGEVKSDSYATKWDEAEVLLGREGFKDLFAHIRMIFSKERAKAELLKEFPEQVLNSFLPDRAAEFIDDVVVPYAEAYAQIKDCRYTATKGAGKVNAWFKRLAQIDNNDWVPPALWALRHHGGDPVWLDRFFAKLERLAASMLVRRVYTSPRLTRYAHLLRDLAGGYGLESPSFNLRDGERAHTLEQLGGSIYLVTKIRKYVLLRLDEVLADSAGVTHDHRIITVEHVLPQNPKAGSRWLADFSGADRAEWTHKLANLVLLNRTKNSQASNYDFVDKKAKYFLGGKGVSTFALTIQVLAHSEWTPEVLEVRQRELVKSLASEWNL
ncbi:DUF262 domain-containing protein [Umezawaea sp. Da 62-37]|uniref:DUF262 domain-containing protein n=1 Tax=Umezawaea sp. Da 62-37 TaxID=3075927 RepID=UPI0028F7441C|nr:DUF262 domain-containing protein [Umezawaea sp. Da 62-37]WNV90012.1 DUF262 domain-containing protein [Umezawaea sp. Da 62-37]